ELKIITYHVVTRDKVMANERQVSILYLVDRFGPLHEKTLMDLVKNIQDLGYDLGYKFTMIGKYPYSPELRNDLTALMYVGFVETEPGMFRKLRTTSDGKDALEKANVPPGLVEVVNKNFETLRNTASIIDGELDLEIRKRFSALKRPRRRGIF
ncbi:MAG: hypothetical protein GSR86_00375, partial [Desulfurococcales archaeon]|nr:hypothetical protein [Desulfurococcales archaeon]